MMPTKVWYVLATLLMASGGFGALIGLRCFQAGFSELAGGLIVLGAALVAWGAVVFYRCRAKKS